MQDGPVFIIDDDTDEHELLRDIWKELNVPNLLVFFSSGQEMLDHLKNAKYAPFIVLSDISLPKMTGLELREKMLEINSKNFSSVPFIFWSTKASQAQIAQAYKLYAHGFFIKQSSINDIKNSFRTILNYWQMSKMPDK